MLIWCRLHPKGETVAARQKNTVRTSVILPEDARARIEALATANDVSAAWVIRHAVLRFLDEHGDQAELPLRLPATRKRACPHDGHARDSSENRAPCRPAARLESAGPVFRAAAESVPRLQGRGIRHTCRHRIRSGRRARSRERPEFPSAAHPSTSQARDIITVTHPKELAADLDLGPVDTTIDVIVGGPPCQAFARVGRSKLREIEEHPEAFKHDPRARLYQEYLRYVDAFQPLVVVMENVPDVLNHGGQNIAEEICEVLEAKGYVCGYTLLNAAYYGVPQTRERMFLVAYRREVTDQVRFPAPTHWVGLPPGYDGTRAVALKLLNQNNLLGADAHAYIRPPEASPRLPPAVTAEEAIGDLPPIYAREEMEAGILRHGARRFDVPLRYDVRRKVSAFAQG